MSYMDSLLVACEDLQSRLVDYWGSPDNVTPRDPIPFLEFLTSPTNTNGINMTVNPGGGKSRTLNLTFDQRILEDTVVEATGRACNTQEKRGNFVETYSIDTDAVVSSGEQIEIKDLTRICEANPDFFVRRLAQHYDVIDRKVASKSAAEAVALVGDYSQDTIDAYSLAADDTLIVATKDSNGAIVPGAWEKIHTASVMSGYTSFIGFGGMLMKEYMNNSLAGCCSNQGLDLGELYNLYGAAYGYDRRLAAAMGSVSTDSLFMEVGALQLLSYVEFPGFEGIQMQSGYERFTAVTPAGIPVDVLMEDSCGAINITVFANTKVVAKPANMFASGDNFIGTRGTGFVTVDNS